MTQDGVSMTPKVVKQKVAKQQVAKQKVENPRGERARQLKLRCSGQLILLLAGQLCRPIQRLSQRNDRR